MKSFKLTTQLNAEMLRMQMHYGCILILNEMTQVPWWESVRCNKSSEGQAITQFQLTPVNDLFIIFSSV